MQYFQDALQGNHCYGCGTLNDKGLAIKSYWATDKLACCEFKPQPHHCAAPTHFLNGGIIATIIDCHCICTAIAHAYQQQGRDFFNADSHKDPLWYATSKLSLKYLRPVTMAEAVLLSAHITAEDDKTISLKCTLQSQGKTCVEAEVLAVRVPNSWMT
ncbi:MAG: PaaI family thioesterase [Pseudomonadales bacterium]|nr:PaaI family thioesterase [Pseudomonadales bacterium]